MKSKKNLYLKDWMRRLVNIVILLVFIERSRAAGEYFEFFQVSGKLISDEKITETHYNAMFTEVFPGSRVKWFDTVGDSRFLGGSQPSAGQNRWFRNHL